MPVGTGAEKLLLFGGGPLASLSSSRLEHVAILTDMSLADWASWASIVGFPLAVGGLFFTALQARSAARRAKGAESAAIRAENAAHGAARRVSILRSNQTLHLLQGSLDGLERSIRDNIPALASHALSSWCVISNTHEVTHRFLDRNPALAEDMRVTVEQARIAQMELISPENAVDEVALTAYVLMSEVLDALSQDLERVGQEHAVQVEEQP